MSISASHVAQLPLVIYGTVTHYVVTGVSMIDNESETGKSLTVVLTGYSSEPSVLTTTTITIDTATIAANSGIATPLNSLIDGIETYVTDNDLVPLT